MHTSSRFIEDDLNNRGYLWIPRVYAQEIKVDFIADRTARSLSPRSFFNGRSSIVTFISQALIYVMPVYINSLHLFDPFIAFLPSNSSPRTIGRTFIAIIIPISFRFYFQLGNLFFLLSLLPFNFQKQHLTKLLFWILSLFSLLSQNKYSFSDSIISCLYI